MAWLELLDGGKFLLFTLVLLRMTGLVMTAPVFGARDVPAQVRALLAFALALLIMPSQWHLHVSPPGTLLQYLVFAGSELLVGACLGIGLEVLFSGIQLAGQMVGRVSGETLAEVFDPSLDENVAVLGHLLWLVMTAVFLCIGGHRAVMAALLDTFRSIPPGSLAVPTSLAETLVNLLAQSFDLGIRAAAPMVVALLLSNLVVGLISRTLPQLNFLALGASLNAILAFAVLSLSIGAAAWLFQDQVEPALEAIVAGLQVPLRSEFLP